MTSLEIIQQCQVNKNVVILPLIVIERKLYLEVAGKLEKIGGKWNKKAGGFVFDRNPAPLLTDVLGGVKRDIKKETQFFATPADVAQFMACELFAEPGQTILEPSAGQGALIEAVLHEYKANSIYWIEKDEHNRKVLQDKFNLHKVYELDETDFIAYNDGGLYDRIIANPPFSKNQDIDHVKKMYECLKPGGRIVSVMSQHWQFSDHKKEKGFREWIEEIGAATYFLESGRFKSSGTMVSSCIVIIDKATGAN